MCRAPVLLAFALIAASCAPDAEQPAPDPEEEQVYLFSYFVGNGEDGLHLAYSQDGLSWAALNGGRSLLTPTAGEDRLMRDPSIVQGPDGTFHMVWTVSWGERGIGYAHSRDLVTWSEQRYLPVMEHEPDAQNCWAPELFYDAATETYLILWSTTIPGRFPETDDQSNEGPPAPGRNHRIYAVTTPDFETFTPTRLFYDQGFNVIDAALVYALGRYRMVLKDETNTPFTPQKNIRVAVADRAEGPYGPPSEPITGDYWAEGPSPLRVGDRWLVYFDKYRLDRYGAVATRDWDTWEDVSDRIVMPEGLRHGTAFAVDRSVLEPLLALE